MGIPSAMLEKFSLTQVLLKLEIKVLNLGYDLRVVAYDDGPGNYTQEIWDSIKKYPNLDYYIGK